MFNYIVGGIVGVLTVVTGYHILKRHQKNVSTDNADQVDYHVIITLKSDDLYDLDTLFEKLNDPLRREKILKLIKSKEIPLALVLYQEGRVLKLDVKAYISSGKTESFLMNLIKDVIDDYASIDIKYSDIAHGVFQSSYTATRLL
jgi:hypothetical protein